MLNSIKTHPTLQILLQEVNYMGQNIIVNNICYRKEVTSQKY